MRGRDMTCALPFWVNRLDALPSTEPSGAPGIGIDDIFRCNLSDQEERWEDVLLASYMTDFPWLLQAIPSLSVVKNTVLLLSGERGSATVERHYSESTSCTTFTSKSALHLNVNPVRAAARAAGMDVNSVVVVEPPLPYPFGTHHTKMCLCVNRKGLRVAIFTANLVRDDWVSKTQGVFVQDFPLQGSCDVPARDSARGRDFKQQLQGYLHRCGLGRGDGLGFDGHKGSPLGLWATDLLSLYDFSSARVQLVASVPGTYSGAEGRKFGLGRLAFLLGSLCHRAGVGEGKGVLSWQYSSQGTLNEGFLTAVVDAMIGGGREKVGEDSTPSLAYAEVQVVYPTEAEVRESLEGWRGGLSIPLSVHKCHTFINERLHRWGKRELPTMSHSSASSSEMIDVDAEDIVESACSASWYRQFALPHMKSYACMDAGRTHLSWFLMTSANLSQAAWGSPSPVKKAAKRRGGTALNADESTVNDEQRLFAKLFIRSYELGVLFDAESAITADEVGKWVSVTPSCATLLRPSLGHADLYTVPLGKPLAHEPHAAVATTESGVMSLPTPMLFLPYDILHPEPYASTAALRAHSGKPVKVSTLDVPWVADIPHMGTDCLGLTIDTAMSGHNSHCGADSWAAPLRVEFPTSGAGVAGGKSSSRRKRQRE